MHVLIWEFEYVQNYWNTCIWIGTFSVFTASLQHVTTGNIQHGVVRSVQHSTVLSDLLSSGKNPLIGLLINNLLSSGKNPLIGLLINNLLSSGKNPLIGLLINNLLSSGKNWLIGLLIRWLMERGNFSIHVDFIFLVNGLKVNSDLHSFFLFLHFFLTVIWNLRK